jgi:CubicO group peptidase (beta-lactamase class C family)
MPFVTLADEVIFKPLKLERTGFGVKKPLLQEAAPTELGNRFEKEMACNLFAKEATTFAWREHLLCGETNDGNSFYQGGTAGNSGLFSTTTELFTLSRQFHPESTTLLNAELVQRFWRNETVGKRSHRSLGFKLNSSIITSGGRAMDRHAIGHSGFTGTSIWLEPEPGYTFIVLTNRIHPQVQSVNFNRIRRKLHRLLVNDLNLKR